MTDPHSIDRIQCGYRLHGVGYRTKARARYALRWYRYADNLFGRMAAWLAAGSA